MKYPIAILASWLLFVSAPISAQQDRQTKVRNDRKDVQDTGLWIYNDLAKGIAAARESGKPLLIVFR